MDSPDVTAITKIVKKVGTEFESASDEDISFSDRPASAGHFQK